MPITDRLQPTVVLDQVRAEEPKLHHGDYETVERIGRGIAAGDPVAALALGIAAGLALCERERLRHVG